MLLDYSEIQNILKSFLLFDTSVVSLSFYLLFRHLGHLGSVMCTPKCKEKPTWNIVFL